eukprot:jgi/Orpsp1_1/1178478/evm.model.c7180000065466.2
MKFLNNLLFFVAVSCLKIFVSAGVIANVEQQYEDVTLDFPAFEDDFTGKNGFYLLYYENISKRFPTLIPAQECRVNAFNASVVCRVEDSKEEQIIKKKFGGAAKLVIDNMKMFNPNNCDTFEKYLTEVVLYNEDDIEYQIIGTTLEEVFAKKFSFKLNDGCEFYGEFNSFHLEKL